MKAIRHQIRQAPGDADAIHELIGLLYEAAVDFRRWPLFLSRLSEATNEGFASHVTREFGMESSAPGLILLRRIPPQSARFADLYQVLGKHLRKALELQRRFKDMEIHQTALEESLNRLLTGVVLLDSRLCVTFMNTSGRSILERRDGLRLQGNMLVAENKSDTFRLQHTFQQLIGMEEPELRSAVVWVSRSSGKRPLGMVVCRGDSGKLTVASAVAVYLSDTDGGMLPDLEVLKQLYGLTSAEGSLALHLLQGKSLEESAQDLCVSLNTARTHLKRVLHKTDTSRQSDLIRLLLTGPACLRF